MSANGNICGERKYMRQLMRLSHIRCIQPTHMCVGLVRKAMCNYLHALLEFYKRRYERARKRFRVNGFYYEG